MPILLFIGSFIFTILIFRLEITGKDGWRSSFIKSSLVFGLIIALSTELLSVFAALHFNSLLILWSALFIGIAGAALHRIFEFWRSKGETAIFPAYFRAKLDLLDAIDRICLIVTGAILCMTLLAALVSPPNNLDSMSYHMPRVMHWIQNASVSHYPTNNLRQISFPPGAEYIIAHFVILSGGDYLANSVQWMSFLGCMIGVSLIAACFSSRKGQIISVLFCATMPMAVLQAATTQTDLTVAFFLVCAAFFIFRTKHYTWSDLAWISLSFSLAILTKPTAYFFGFPLGVALSLRLTSAMMKKHGFLSAAAKVVTVICCVGFSSASLSVPGYWRNIVTFGNPLGPDGGIRSAVLGLKPLVSNLTRNIALNFPLPNYWRWVETVHATVLDLDVDDNRTTFQGNAFSKCPEWLFLLPDEDFAGNPLHLLICIFSGAVIILRRLTNLESKIDDALVILSVAVAGIVLYSLLIKWQIWGGRLQLPVFIFLAPVAGYVIAQSRRSIIVILVVLLLIQGSFYSLFAARHPLISLQRFNSPIFRAESIFQTVREDLYFNGNFEYIENPIKELKKSINTDGCWVLGITLARPEFEYAVWAILNNGSKDKVKIVHLGVENPSKFLNQVSSVDPVCAATIEMKTIHYTRYD